MREKAFEKFLEVLNDRDLNSMSAAEVGGKTKITLVQNNDGKVCTYLKNNPLISLFKSYTSFDIDPYRSNVQHDITKNVPAEYKNTYDIVMSFDTLEHIYNPFLACKNMIDMVKNNGLLYVSTVFCWPSHGHNDDDYFRFSPEGLRTCFDDLPAYVAECDWDGDSSYFDEHTGVFLLAVKRNG